MVQNRGEKFCFSNALTPGIAALLELLMNVLILKHLILKGEVRSSFCDIASYLPPPK